MAPAWIDARAGDDAFVDGTLESEHQPAQIANGCESAHQRGRRLGACTRLGGRCRRKTALQVSAAPASCACTSIRRASAFQGPLPSDEHGAGASISWDRIRGDALDLVAAHQDVLRFRKKAALAVEDSDILKQRCAPWCRLCMERGGECPKHDKDDRPDDHCMLQTSAVREPVFWLCARKIATRPHSCRFVWCEIATRTSDL